MKKLTLEEFGDLMQKSLTEVHLNPGYRLGQAMYNNLFEMNRELADSIRMTGADCFHQDSKIIHFVNAILQ
jgi:hypothetical protein